MIDLYCERVGPGLWAEPINAITNLAFFSAAFAAYRLADRCTALSVGIWLLIGLMVTIGIGSGLFHTFATNWARVLDIVPILLFQLTYLWLYGRRLIEIRASRLGGLVVLYIVSAYIGRQFPYVLNGSLIYAPAFVLSLALGIYHHQHARHEATLLLWATGVFCVSLFFRGIDLMACDYISIGTHFLWHLLNGVLVYLAVRALVLNLPNSGDNG